MPLTNLRKILQGSRRSQLVRRMAARGQEITMDLVTEKVRMGTVQEMVLEMVGMPMEMVTGME
jgi:hypothetical protein